MIHDPNRLFEDPVKMVKLIWPELRMYDKQAEIMRSVWANDETYVPAGNVLGKDWISGLIALCFFLSRSPCRVVTTSVDYSQLEGVLWGEIRQFIRTASIPLPIEVNHLHIYQKIDGQRDAKSELIGRVVKKGEGLLGRHLPQDKARTLVIFDESSGIEDLAYNSADTWAHKKLAIGNCYPCSNFFKKHIAQGDVLASDGKRFYRKIIRIKASDSPNVIAQRQVLPGVISYDEYKKRRALWDPIRQCIGLDAEFYEGAEELLYPTEWLNRAEQVAESLAGTERNGRRTLGVDPAEGGDNTSWTVIDSLGILRMISKRTYDTTKIVNQTLALMKEYGIEPEDVFFDRGGGGKQHVDRLRSDGYKVNSVGFGESVTDSSPTVLKSVKRERAEARYAYKNRRAQMYGILRFELLDPQSNPEGFGIPASLVELRRQLAPLPLLYDNEGRLYLPPKRKIGNSTAQTLHDLLGCSPDEADSLALAAYGLMNPVKQRLLGAY